MVEVPTFFLQADFLIPPKKEKAVCVGCKMGKSGIWEYRLDILGM